MSYKECKDIYAFLECGYRKPYFINDLVDACITMGDLMLNIPFNLPQDVWKCSLGTIFSHIILGLESTERFDVAARFLNDIAQSNLCPAPNGWTKKNTLRWAQHDFLADEDHFHAIEMSMKLIREIALEQEHID